MAKSVNKVILLGNLGKDAETKFTTSGVPRTTFSIATTRRFKDTQTGEWKDETDWHNIILWRAENVANYLTKGKQVYVEGRLQTRSWDDKDGNKRYSTEVVVSPEDLILLGGRGGGEASGGETGMSSGGSVVSMPRSAAGGGRPAPAPAAAPAAEATQFNDVISDDDVPF